MNDKKKIALVTGASRGIGKSIALRLAQEGYQVIGTATSAEGAKNITESLTSHAQFPCVGKIMLLEEESIKDLFEELKQEELIPTILVANAGITADNLILRMKKEEWQKTLDANLTSTFFLCQRAVKRMIKEKWGRIVCLSSVVAFIGNIGQVNYVATKAGINGVCKSLAREFASRNITVNSVAPGFIDTDMTRGIDEKMQEQLLQQIAMRRYGLPEEVAAAVSFLVSEDAAYITGQTLHVNGGMYMA